MGYKQAGTQKTQYKIYSFQTNEIVPGEYAIGTIFKIDLYCLTFYFGAECPSSKTKSVFLNIF